MDTSIEVVFSWNVFPLSNADIRFTEQLVCWSYIMQRPCLLTTTRRVEFVDRRGYPVAAVAQRVDNHTIV